MKRRYNRRVEKAVHGCMINREAGELDLMKQEMEKGTQNMQRRQRGFQE